LKSRADTIGTGEQVQLKAIFRNVIGVETDLDAFPQIMISEPDNATYMNLTSTGVSHIATGTYAYTFTAPINGSLGAWSDFWSGYMAGDPVTGTFAFIVSNLDIDVPAADGYEQLGDAPDRTLSQSAIHNLNILMDLLRRRLQSSGRHKVFDANGNEVYENCDIFSVDELYSFLCCALSEFNQTPHFTAFTFDDPMILNFADILVEGGYIMALASKALIEKGREFTISDNGLSFQPPAVSELLNSQMSTLLTGYRDKLKLIKHQFKSFLGLGTLRTTAVAPQVMRLRHRRTNRFF
jgi:hypothetical protein